MTNPAPPVPCPFCGESLAGTGETCAGCGKVLPPRPHLAPLPSPKRVGRLVLSLVLLAVVAGAFTFSLVNLFLRVVTYHSPFTPYLLLAATSVMLLVFLAVGREEGATRQQAESNAPESA